MSVVIPVHSWTQPAARLSGFGVAGEVVQTQLMELIPK